MRSCRERAASALLLGIGALALGLASAAASDAPVPDVAAGRAIYARCAACHSIERDRTGPRHCGLFGRRAGAVPGFAYSGAMRASGIVWNERTLDAFIANPLATVPGTFMGYAGIPDPAERAQLLAFLEVATRSDACAARSIASPP
jgi:cytochrome c